MLYLKRRSWYFYQKFKILLRGLVTKANRPHEWYVERHVHFFLIFLFLIKSALVEPLFYIFLPSFQYVNVYFSFSMLHFVIYQFSDFYGLFSNAYKGLTPSYENFIFFCFQFRTCFGVLDITIILESRTIFFYCFWELVRVFTGCLRSLRLTPHHLPFSSTYLIHYSKLNRFGLLNATVRWNKI